MALGAKFNKKFDLNKNLSVSNVYSDISMSGTDTLFTQGGTGHNQVALFNFTVPSKPSFGDAELEGISTNFYIRNIDVYPNSGTALTGLSAYRINVDDITEGGNSITARPTVISTTGENFNYIHDNFDGSKAVTLTSKNYKLEVQGDKVVMLKDAYLSYENMVAFVEQGAGPTSTISYYDNWKQKNPYMNGPEYIVPATKTKYGWSLGKQKTNLKFGWSYNYEFGPFSTSTDDGKWLENHMSYASEIVTDTSLDKESASEYSTIFDFVYQHPEMTYIDPDSGSTEDYWISSAKFGTENTFGGGRSLKIHNKWAWTHNGTYDDDNGVSGNSTLKMPVLLGSIPGTEYRQPAGAIGTGVVSGRDCGIGQSSVDRQEVKMGIRIPSAPTSLSAFRKGTIEKFDDMFIDFDMFIEKLAPAYRGSKGANGVSGYKTPANDASFPNPAYTTDVATNRPIFCDYAQATLRRSVTWTLGERPARESENLYDYVQDNMLWFCKVTEVDVAHDSDGGDGAVVHKFRCDSPDTRLQQAVKATTTITITGNATADQTIVIIDAESSPNTFTYTAKSTETVANRQFRATGTVNQIRDSLQACIEHSAGHNGKIECIPHPRDDGVLLLRQITAGTAGNTSVTNGVSNLSVANTNAFAGGAAQGSTTLHTGSDEIVSFGGNRDTFDNLADSTYLDDTFNGHSLMFVNSANDIDQKVRHIIDFDATKGTITLDDSLGGDVAVNDIFLVWSGNYYGATNNDGSAITNVSQRPIARKNFAMGTYLKTSQYVEVENTERINLGIHYFDTAMINSGGLFLWPPTCDVHAGMPKRTSATAGVYHPFLLENFPEKTHVNVNMNFFAMNESHRHSGSPVVGSAGTQLGTIKWLPSGHNIRDTNIGDADANKVIFERIEDVGTDGIYNTGGNTRQFYNINVKLAKSKTYPGAARTYDDSTATDDWNDAVSPSDAVPQYFTLWFTNYPNVSRMDRVEGQSNHKAVDMAGGNEASRHNWMEYHIESLGAAADEDDILTDDDDMESIVFLNTFSIGNVQPTQKNSTYIDREALTSQNMARARITIPRGKVNNLNWDNDHGIGNEELQSSFICLGFENASDILAPDASDTDSATNQKYLLWSGFDSKDDGDMNSYGGWNWGSDQNSDQLALMYSNTIERLGDWDASCSFATGSLSKTSFPRGLSEGSTATDSLDHDSDANAPDGFKQKGFWKMKWHPRNIGLKNQNLDTREDATSFTCNNLTSNYNIADFFNGWEIYWRTGNNAGTTSTVTDYSAGGVITHTATSQVTAQGNDFDLYPTWEKRENPWASTKIVKIINQNTFHVASDIPLDGWSDDTFIIYRMGTGVSSLYQKRGVGFNTSTAKKYYKSGIKIISAPVETDDNNFVVRIDSIADNAEDGSTDLINDGNLAELWICPEKYWLTLSVTNNTYVNSKVKAGNEKSFSSVCVTQIPSVGTTYNELLYSDAQSYTNRWNITRSVAGSDGLVASGLILDRDYGFGAFNDETDITNSYVRDKGMLGYQNVIQNTSYNKIDLDGLVTTDNVEEGDKVTIGFSPISSLDSHLITLDSRSYTAGNKPYMVAKYRDALPTISNFKIQPDKENNFYPKITWSVGDNDAWYGFLIIDDTNINNQYHNAVIHFPLNESGTHGTAAGIPTEKIKNTTNTISGPLYDLEGLAGYSLNFDGNDDYVECNNSPSSDPTGTCTTEMSVVAHIIPDSASDQRYIVAQSSRSNLEKFHIRLNTSNKVEARVHFGAGANYVDLTSASIINTDGETPTNIILTVDTTLMSGNVKLFINGKLEDMTGVALATGTTNNWDLGTNIHGGNSEIYIGNSASSGTNGFDGKIEEIVIYDKCIYPIVPADGNFIFDKPISELQSGESLASSKSHVARLIIKDYHNIRGSSSSEVTISPQLSWRKAAFALDTT